MKYFLLLISTITILFISIQTSNAKIPETILVQTKAIVTIYIEDNKEIIAVGSGFIISSDGIIVTNNHVIKPWNNSKSGLLYVKKSDGTFLEPLEIKASDEQTDVALIKVKESNLPHININSDYKPNQGDDVFVIGTPLGFETTITNGIVSSIRGDDGFLQISAPISPGSSGSPVLNSKGEAIGVATLIVTSGQNLNFAIPISYVSNLLKNGNKVAANKEDKIITLGEKVIQPKALSKPEAEEILLPQIPVGSHRGKILDTMDSDDYTYIKYLEDGNESWLALQKTSVMLGDIIDFPDITPILDFNSKSLKRTFNKITFVPELKVIYRERKYFKNSDEYYEYLANQFISYNDSAGAVQVFTKAIEENPKSDRIYYDRSNAHWFQLHIPSKEEKENNSEQIKKNNIDHCNYALNDISKAINIESNIAAYYEKRADILSDESYCSFNDLNGAIRDYDIAIDLNPKSAYNYYVSKGRIYETLNDYSNMYSCAQKAISINKDMDWAYLLLAEYYIKFNNIKKALDNYKIANFIKPNLFTSLVIDDILIKDKLYKEAIIFYTSLINKHPDKIYYYESRAKFYSMSNKYKEAISDYSVVIKSGSEDDQIYSGRAFCYYKTKQNNLASNDYREACELSKDEKSFPCDMVKSIKKEISRGDKWVYYASSGSTEYYYDKNSIKHLTKGDIRVWERMEENADSYIKYLTKEGLPTQGYETYSFTLNLDEYDCKNMKTGILTTIDYNEKGEVLYSTTVQTVKMREIIPDTIGESLYKLVCQEKKKSKKQK